MTDNKKDVQIVTERTGIPHYLNHVAESSFSCLLRDFTFTNSETYPSHVVFIVPLFLEFFVTETRYVTRLLVVDHKI